MPTPNTDDPIHNELRAMQDCRASSSDSAREFWRTMYSRARTTGWEIGRRAHELLITRGRVVML